MLAGTPAHAQTDVAASLYGAFSGSTTASGTSNVPGGGLLSPSNAAGALIELRHIKNPLVGYEATRRSNDWPSLSLILAMGDSTRP